MESIRDDVVTIVYLIIQTEYYIFGIRLNYSVPKNIGDKVFFTELKAVQKVRREIFVVTRLLLSLSYMLKIKHCVLWDIKLL
jgi:hypothetical protein